MILVPPPRRVTSVDAVMSDNDIWLHVNTTHGSFNTMKNDAETKHKANAPGTELSITYNVAGTEAIVKIRGGKGWNPGWMNAPFVKRVYTAADHHEIFKFFYTQEWQKPEEK